MTPKILNNVYKIAILVGIFKSIYFIFHLRVITLTRFPYFRF